MILFQISIWGLIERSTVPLWTCTIWIFSLALEFLWPSISIWSSRSSGVTDRPRWKLLRLPAAVERSGVNTWIQVNRFDWSGVLLYIDYLFLSIVFVTQLFWFTFSYVCPFIVIRLDAVIPKLNFVDDIVELENCVLRVGGSFGTTTASRFLRLPSLNEDSVAPDLCLDGLSSVL